MLISGVFVLVLFVGLCTAYTLREEACRRQCFGPDDCTNGGFRPNVLVCDYTTSLKIKLDCVANCLQQPEIGIDAAGIPRIVTQPDISTDSGKITFSSLADPQSLLSNRVVASVLQNIQQYPFHLQGTNNDLYNVHPTLDPSVMQNFARRKRFIPLYL